MGEYVIALDQGTTSSRAVLIDRLGRIKGMSQSPFPQLFPQPGWVEHSPKDILSSQLKVLAGNYGINRCIGKPNRQYRYYQPAGDHRCMGSRHGRTHSQRHCVAMPSHHRNRGALLLGCGNCC